MPLWSGVTKHARTMCHHDVAMERFDLKAFIKEVGRGPKGSKDLSRADAQTLFGAILEIGRAHV